MNDEMKIKFKLVLIILCLVVARTGWADSLDNGVTKSGNTFPKILFANSKIDHSDIFTTCSEVDDASGDIICKFRERMVFHEDLEANEKELHDLKDEKGFTKFIEVLRSACVDARYQKSLDDFDRMNKNRKYTQKFNHVCEQLRKNQIISLQDDLIRQAAEELNKDKLSCGIEAKSYEQRFTYHKFSRRWIYQSPNPRDICGIIDIAYLEKVDENTWNYATKMVITNKSAIDPRGSCMKLKARESDVIYYGNLFDNNSEQRQLMNCKYITFRSDERWG